VIIVQNIHKPKRPIYGDKKSTKSAPSLPLSSPWTSIACANIVDKNSKVDAMATWAFLKSRVVFLYKT